MKVEDPDEALSHVWDVLEGEDEGQDFAAVEAEVNPLLDGLVTAGYVEQWGRSETGCLWRISADGHERLKKLGRDA